MAEGRRSSVVRTASVLGAVVALVTLLSAQTSEGKDKAKPAAKPVAKPKTTATAKPAAKPAPPRPWGRTPSTGKCDDMDVSLRCAGDYEVCSNNVCYCPTGYARCEQPSSDTYKNCNDLRDEFRNCGACGHECKDGQMCEKGKCVAFHCDKGETDCPQGCFDLKTDSVNCGACGHVCPGGGSCVAGSCRL